MVTTTSLMLAAVMLLGACGHRELKAPCGPDEGRPTGMPSAVTSLMPVEDWLFGVSHTGTPLDRLAAAPALDPCGPMRPINQPNPSAR